MTKSNIFTTFLLLCFLGLWASAAPILRRIVYNPPILTPAQGTVWTAGTTESCTWNTTGLPQELQNATGSLVLGYLLAETGANEHLDLANPLAAGFPLSTGSVSFSVPANLTQRDSYIVVLFGDSGNASPGFTIRSAATSLAVASDSSASGAGASRTQRSSLYHPAVAIGVCLLACFLPL